MHLCNVAVSYTKKVRSVYKRQPNILVVTAFKNGSHEQSARVTAPNLQLVTRYFLTVDRFVKFTFSFSSCSADLL